MPSFINGTFQFKRKPSLRLVSNGGRSCGACVTWFWTPVKCAALSSGIELGKPPRINTLRCSSKFHPSTIVPTYGAGRAGKDAHRIRKYSAQRRQWYSINYQLSVIGKKQVIGFQFMVNGKKLRVRCFSFWSDQIASPGRLHPEIFDGIEQMVFELCQQYRDFECF